MLIVNFDLIALPAETLPTRQPSLSGRRIWNMLFNSYSGQIILMCVGDPNMEVLLHWLKTENFKPSVIDISKEYGLKAKQERLQALLAAYGRAQFYVDSEPEAVAMALHEGVSALLCVEPHLYQPDWGSPKQVKSWSTITDEIEEQSIKQAELTWKDL